MSRSDQISKKRKTEKSGLNALSQQEKDVRTGKNAGLYKAPQSLGVSARGQALQPVERPLGEDEKIKALPVDHDTLPAYELLNKRERNEYNKYIKEREEVYAQGEII